MYKEGAEETVGRKEKQGLSGKDGGIRCSESCEPINDRSAGLYNTDTSSGIRTETSYSIDNRQLALGACCPSWISKSHWP